MLHSFQSEYSRQVLCIQELLITQLFRVGRKGAMINYNMCRCLGNISPRLQKRYPVLLLVGSMASLSENMSGAVQNQNEKRNNVFLAEQFRTKMKKKQCLPCRRFITFAHGRDDEQALLLLLQCGYSVEEALRRKRMNAGATELRKGPPEILFFIRPEF